MNKKFLAIAMVGLLAVSMCACNKTKTEADPDDTPPDEIVTPVETDDGKEFLFATFDDEAVIKFVDESLKEKGLTSEPTLSSALIKSVLVGESVTDAEAVKTMIKDTVDGLVVESANKYVVKVEKTETSAVIKIYYTVAETEDPKPEVEPTTPPTNK